MKQLSNIWVIQTSFLGDCVLTLPFLHELLRLSPSSDIQIITTPQTIEIFEMAKMRGLSEHSHRLHLVPLDKRGRHKSALGFLNFVSELKKTFPPGRVYCLQRSFRSGLLALFSGSTERIGFSSGSAAFLYTQDVARDWDSGKLEIEKNLDLLRATFSQEVFPWNPGASPSILGRSKDISIQVNLPAEAPVVVALGSPWATKRWPVENVVELLKLLYEEGHRVVLVGDPSSKDLGVEVESRAPSFLLTNKVGKTSLGEWVDTISTARVLVANDSAAVHIAGDLGVPVVALFGPTLREFGFAPFRPGSKALFLSDLPCRPCGIHGLKECPLKHHRCLKDISGRIVRENIEKWL